MASESVLGKRPRPYLASSLFRPDNDHDADNDCAVVTWLGSTGPPLSRFVDKWSGTHLEELFINTSSVLSRPLIRLLERAAPTLQVLQLRQVQCAKMQKVMDAMDLPNLHTFELSHGGRRAINITTFLHIHRLRLKYVRFDGCRRCAVGVWRSLLSTARLVDTIGTHCSCSLVAATAQALLSGAPPRFMPVTDAVLRAAQHESQGILEALSTDALPVSDLAELVAQFWVTRIVCPPWRE
jgi:hypothetical protein